MKPLFSFLVAGAMSLAAFSLHAQAWPAKPVRIVVPFPPGGIVDMVARQLQPGLQQALGQTVIIDNKAGAGGSVGSAEVSRAPADGHTLLMVFDSYVTYPLVYPQVGEGILKKLAPVTQIASNPLVLVVSPRVTAPDLKALVAQLRSQPDKFNYATTGAGSSNHLTAEYFKSVSATQINHVPYRGGGPAQQDLLGGQVDMMFLSAVLAQPHVKAGKLRALAQTGAQRSPAYASVPTVAESGYPGFEVESWVGLLAPAGTPAPVIARLQSEVAKILAAPAFRARLEEQGLKGIGSTPEQFGQTLATERQRWARLVAERKLPLE
jgi:tripartite-type tricarboxylate transporter receptor subunit TctC